MNLDEGDRVVDVARIVAGEEEDQENGIVDGDGDSEAEPVGNGLPVEFAEAEVIEEEADSEEL